MSYGAPFAWGDLELYEDNLDATYSLRALAGDGVDLDLGNPEPIEEAVRSLLQDGSVVFSQGHDNRTVSIAVLVRGGDARDLSRGELALMQQVGRPSLLTWRGSQDYTSVPSVFEAVSSQLLYTFDPDREAALSRLYVIELLCLPWVRSETLVVSESPVVAVDPPVPATEVVDAGNSTTGWSASAGTVAAADGGTAVSSTGGPPGVNLTRAGVVDMTDRPYLQVHYKNPGGLGNPTLTLDGIGHPLAAIGSSPHPGYTLATFEGALSFTELRLAQRMAYGGSLTVTEVAKTNFVAGSGTARQMFRQLPIAGSVRTSASLLVEHDDAALGDGVMVYTWADDGSGYLPPLRPHRTGGGLVTADPALVSGAWEPINTDTEFTIPARSFPQGYCRVMARLRCTEAADKSVAWTASTRVGGVQVGAVESGIATVTFTTPDTWQTSPLFAIPLPVSRLGGTSNAEVRITLSRDLTGVDMDEAWLFNMDIGALTQVDCGAGAPTVGGPSRRLWVEPAVVDQRPTVLRGHSEDGSDAFYAGTGIQSLGVHEVAPNAVNVLTVTPGAENARTSASYFPRWHTHALAVKADGTNDS